MKIELKSIKTYPALSEETTAYSATVYIDGKRAFAAKNDGRGGSDSFSPFKASGYKLIQEAEEYAATLPDKVFPPNPDIEGDEEYVTEMDLDLLIGEIISKFDHEKHLKSKAVSIYKKVIFIEQGELRSFKSAYREEMDLEGFKKALPSDGAILLSGLSKELVMDIIKQLVDGEGDREDHIDTALELLEKAGVKPEAANKAMGISPGNMMKP